MFLNEDQLEIGNKVRLICYDITKEIDVFKFKNIYGKSCYF